MPVNLPPQYHKKEAELKDAGTLEEKISILEDMLSIMPKHKSSEKLQALLKSKIAKYRKEREKGPHGSRRGIVPSIEKEGAGQAVICGPANSGKSSLLSALTKARPDIADYPFTTKLPFPGMLKYGGVKIQLIDTPPLTSESIENWMRGFFERADMLVFIFDMSSNAIIEEMDDALKVLEKFRIKEEGTFCFSKKILWVANKTDNPGYSDIKEVFNELYGSFIGEVYEVSAREKINTEHLPGEIFKKLDIIRVYTKTPGKPADEENPYTLKRGSTVIELAEHIHKDIAGNFRYARLWRKGEEKVIIAGREYILDDLDIVEVHS